MNRLKIWMFGAMVCLVGLGFSDTANGQITTNPPLSSGMSFQVQSGGAVSSQELAITTVLDPTTIFVTVPANQTWLTVNGRSSGSFPYNTTGSSSAPLTLPVTVNTAGFNTGQVISASITIGISGQGTQVSFPVTMTVGTPSLLSANPASLSFSAVQGATSGSPNSIPVIISSSGAQLTYNVSASTTSGGSWILLTNTTATTNGTTAGFQVQVNPQNLGAGTYTGTVFVQSTTTGDSVAIAVTLSVTAGATLNVTGTLQDFIYQFQSGQGNFSAQQQTLMISTNSGSLNYSATVTPTGTTQGNTTNWLVLSATGGTATSTPQPFNLSLSYQYVAALQPGTYTLNLAIAPTGPSGPANTTNIPVTLVISQNPLLEVNTHSLSFTVPFGSTASPTQSVQVMSSSGSSIPYLVQSNVNWLVINPTSGSTSQSPTFSVSVNASQLAVSSTPYMATISVVPNNSDFGLYTVPISVSVTVTGATSTIYAGPDALLFSYQTNVVSQSQPPLQLVQLTSTSVLGFTVTTNTTPASNCPTNNWLSATQSQSVTPATLSVSVTTTGMSAGFCTGTVIVTYNNGSNSSATLNIPVTVDIASTSLLTVTPPFGFGVVTATSGSNTLISSQISINSTDGTPLHFSATASTPNAPTTWLFLGSSSGTTQQYLQVQISPSGLAVGTYTGSITISPSNAANLPSGPLVIPVVLTVSANTTVTVSPTSLSFSQSQNASTLPASQTISLTATGGTTTFTASVAPVTGGTWLQVSPLSGTASSTAGPITASVLQNSLSPGTYTANIVLTFQNAATPTVTVPVSLVVGNAQTVTAAPTSLTFAYQLGSSAPAAQTINVTSTGGPATFTAVASTTSPWLSVTPASGTTPGTLSVSVNQTLFTAAGAYDGGITITASGQAPIVIPVVANVAGVQMPQPSTISNSASGAFGAISPGELITIKGINLGPTTATNFTVGQGGTLSNTLAGVQVMFDTNPGTPIYVSPTQINVIVPYEIAGRSTTTVTVIYQNQPSAGISQLVASQAPGIYTVSATGAGQASVLNQNGTLNGPSTGLTIGGQFVSTTPASQGSVIAIYMTGGGQTNPASVTGTVTPTGTLYKLPGTITATINGVNAPVQFAGAAPALVNGVVQVNVTVPAGVTGSALPLSVTINNSVTLSGPTVSVQ